MIPGIVQIVLCSLNSNRRFGGNLNGELDTRVDSGRLVVKRARDQAARLRLRRVHVARREAELADQRRAADYLQ